MRHRPILAAILGMLALSAASAAGPGTGRPALPVSLDPFTAGDSVCTACDASVAGRASADTCQVACAELPGTVGAPDGAGDPFPPAASDRHVRSAPAGWRAPLDPHPPKPERRY